MKRSILLPLLATAATLSIVTHTLEAAEAPPPTRLANAIREELAARDKALADKARAIELRERAAKAIEQRMAAAQPDTPAPAPAAAKPGAGPAGAAAAPFDSLASIYQAMKPAKAAAVMERLELPVQVEIASRMRERSTALILAQMEPDAAAALSMALARRPAKPDERAEPRVASRS